MISRWPHNNALEPTAASAWVALARVAAAAQREPLDRRTLNIRILQQSISQTADVAFPILREVIRTATLLKSMWRQFTGEFNFVARRAIGFGDNASRDGRSIAGLGSRKRGLFGLP